MLQQLKTTKMKEALVLGATVFVAATLAIVAANKLQSMIG